MIKTKGNKNKMRPRGRKRKLAASAMLSLRLLFGGPQLASSNSNTFQSGGNSETEISRVSEQNSPSMSAQPEQVRKGTQGSQIALKIPSGGDSSRPSKFGPGSKAKGAAKRDFARRQTSNKPTSSGTIFAEAFSPNIIYGSRPTPLPGNFNIPKAPSGRYPAKLDENQFNPNQYPPGCSKEIFIKYSADTRFEELSIDPQTHKDNPKSQGEACSILQAESESMVKNPRRPNLKKGEPNLDFAIERPGNYRYADVKTPRDPSSFPRNPKNRPPSLAKVARTIGNQIRNQKGGSDNVIHVVNFFHIPSDKIQTFKENLIKGAGNSDGIVFINKK